MLRVNRIIAKISLWERPSDRDSRQRTALLQVNEDLTVGEFHKPIAIAGTFYVSQGKFGLQTETYATIR